MPTDHRPAELLDLDRCDMETMSCEEFERRALNLEKIIWDRRVAEANVRAMQEQERKAANDRKAMRFVGAWFLVSLIFAGVALYLRSIGE